MIAICNECGRETEVEVLDEKHHPAHHPPRRLCPRCAVEIEGFYDAMIARCPVLARKEAPRG